MFNKYDVSYLLFNNTNSRLNPANAYSKGILFPPNMTVCPNRQLVDSQCVQVKQKISWVAVMVGRGEGVQTVN